MEIINVIIVVMIVLASAMCITIFIDDRLVFKYRVVQFQDGYYGIGRKKIFGREEYNGLTAHTGWYYIDNLDYFSYCKTDDLSKVCNILEQLNRPKVIEIKCKIQA